MLHIRDTPESNLAPETEKRDPLVLWLCQSVAANPGTAQRIWTRPLLPHPFQFNVQ
jgi:hypothetical protein